MIYLETEDIEKTIRQLQRLSPRLRAAANRAVRKTVTLAYNEIVRKGAAAADINQRGLRTGIQFPTGKRVYRRDITVKNLTDEASVYVGYNPLKSAYVATIPKWRRGQVPRVRGHRFPGAFVATMRSGHRGIFRRIPGTRMRGKDKEQIDEVKVPLEPVEQIVRALEPQMGKKMRGLLVTELEIELRKLGSL